MYPIFEILYKLEKSNSEMLKNKINKINLKKRFFSEYGPRYTDIKHLRNGTLRRYVDLKVSIARAIFRRIPEKKKERKIPTNSC